MKKKPVPKKYTPREYVLKYFPDAGDGLISHIIWGLTGYPGFWHIPRDGNTAYQCFCKSIRQVAGKLKAGISIDRQTWESWDKPMLEGSIRDLKELESKVRARKEPVTIRDSYDLWCELSRHGVGRETDPVTIAEQLKSMRIIKEQRFEIERAKQWN